MILKKIWLIQVLGYILKPLSFVIKVILSEIVLEINNNSKMLE